MENKFRFLAKHSLSKKLKNKWFILGNILVAILIIGLVNIDFIVTLFGGKFNDDVNINVLDNTGYYETVKEGLKTVEDYVSSSVKIKKVDNLDKIKKKLKNTDDILIILNKDIENVYNCEIVSDSYIDAIKYQAIVSSLNASKQSIAFSNSNIDKEELDKISKQVEVKRSFLSEDKNKNEEDLRSVLSTFSLILVLPCFMLIVFLVQMIGAEINEEKSTRGMEIIIGNVSVKTHFFSKVLASNIFVLLQGFLLFCYAGIGLIIRKLTTQPSALVNKAISAADSLNINGIVKMLTESNIIDRLGYIIPLLLILLVLSFLGYSLLAGVLASMTTNMENFQQLQTPLMIISVIGYYLTIVSIAFPGALFIKIVSVIPLLSISIAPSLILSSQISVEILILAILLMGLVDYLLIKYGLRIYKEGILNYSETNLWKKMFKAVKKSD